MRLLLSDRLRSVQLASAFVAAALTGFGLSSANAQSISSGGNRLQITREGAKTGLVTIGTGPYFIEFRSRYAWDYGHTYIVHGKVGEPLTRASVAGLSPVGDDATAWVIGHYVPVPAETGWTDGDLEDKYITSRFRVLMSKDQYDRTMAYVRDLQGRSHMWSAELYNCNAFVADIAKQMGLRVPSSTLIYPKIFINHLRMMNTNNPNADETLVSDNVKEMSNPTRDGRAMIANNVYTIGPDGQPQSRMAPSNPSSTPKVTIGTVHVSSKTTSPDAAAAPTR
jgi:hypothetical protein